MLFSLSTTFFIGPQVWVKKKPPSFLQNWISETGQLSGPPRVDGRFKLRCSHRQKSHRGLQQAGWKHVISEVNILSKEISQFRPSKTCAQMSAPNGLLDPDPLEFESIRILRKMNTSEHSGFQQWHIFSWTRSNLSVSYKLMWRAKNSEKAPLVFYLEDNPHQNLSLYR